MKISKKTSYSSSEKTREKILSAARDLFAKMGFAAASISKIAAKARINQSLIYHHFGSKEELWKAVKHGFSQAFEQVRPSSGVEITDLDSLMQEIVVKRLNRYLDNPELVRIMGWQKMEKSRDHLAGGTPASPSKWKKIIEALQKKKEINPDVSADLIVLLIVSLTSGAVSEDYEKALQNPKNRKQYTELVIASLKGVMTYPG